VGHLAHLHARDTSFAAVSRAPYPKILPFKARMGWTRDRVFRTYTTYERGLDGLGSTTSLLDLTALGRQEEWEEPKGRASAYGAPAGSERTRYHDECED
jgi:predicted dithiol-disulfide oxidoreductase (DUF899 family)